MSHTELIVIRHGETTWNREHRFQGHLDSPLTELGMMQAEAIAERLAGEAFDALYSSDLPRALRTAERIAARSGHRIVTAPGLRERNLGVLQTLNKDEAAHIHPEVYARYRGGAADYAIPGGESARQFFERAIGALAAIAEALAGRRAVVVSHGGVLDALYRHAAGLAAEGPRLTRLPNAAINRFHYRRGRFSLAVWGDAAHLETETAADAG